MAFRTVIIDRTVTQGCVPTMSPGHASYQVPRIITDRQTGMDGLISVQLYRLLSVLHTLTRAKNTL
jgi:hypothetical protein